MFVLLISGSSRIGSTNGQFLNQLELSFPAITFKRFDIDKLPLFDPNLKVSEYPKIVNNWREIVANSEGVLISTPEYIHNIPATLKNCLEWLSSTGEMLNKKVLPITLTPRPPRGQYAMSSLLHSLKALDADLVAHMPLYLTEMGSAPDNMLSEDVLEMIEEGLKLIWNHLGKL